MSVIYTTFVNPKKAALNLVKVDKI